MSDFEPPDHRCLVCNIALIPVYRALCAGCFPKVPWALRADLLHAHGTRISRRANYEETLIRLRQWALNYDGEKW